MVNFCPDWGTKLQKDYNFCPDCGTEIHKTNIKQNKDLLESWKNIAEKLKKEGEKKKLKTTIKKEVGNGKTEKSEMTRGGYCSLSCRHCYEEFFDSGGYFEYYCRLGYPITIGSFCEDTLKKTQKREIKIF